MQYEKPAVTRFGSLREVTLGEPFREKHLLQGGHEPRREEHTLVNRS
jgi:hypothetical protein